MPRVDSDDFGDQELARVFIAATMAEARAAEALLTAGDIDYVVQAEPLGRTLFGSPRNNAVFYVVPEQAALSVNLLLSGGLDIGVVRTDR
jgi:hypothetical protein